MEPRKPQRNKPLEMPEPSGDRDARELLRLLQYTIFRMMGFSRTVSGRKVGYAESSLRNSTFLESLDERARIQGVVADVELPVRQLFMTQVSASFARLIWLRDNAKQERVRLDAASRLLALAGYATTQTRIEPVDLAEQELKKLSPVDRQRFIERGELPPGAQAVEQAPPRTEEEIDAMLAEAMAQENPLA